MSTKTDSKETTNDENWNRQSLKQTGVFGHLVLIIRGVHAQSEG